MVTFSNSRLSLPQSPAVPAFAAESNRTSDSIDRIGSVFVRRQRAADQGGNSLANAAILIQNRGKKQISDRVNRRDVDFYRVDLTTAANIKLNFSNRSNATIVGRLLDGQGQSLFYQGQQQTISFAPDLNFSKTLRNIEPGIYYIQVSTRSRANAQYRLTLNVSDAAARPSTPDCGCGS
ncbi:PPC domain-containing protein [Leptolyngbya ohadii]|uniref:PPC domain-containing protein n=1 Tax=Leptolyngbya ohadii TaxID=1962290 RepID=UPI000B5A20EE|nr:PPC domain-containing protein [Leptolyngbya ohadii]